MISIPVWSYPAFAVPHTIPGSFVPVTFPTIAEEPVSVDEVVRQLKWPAGTPDETDIPRWIAAARSIVERETWVMLAVQEADLFVDAFTGTPAILVLPASPVVSIDEIAIQNGDGTETVLDPSLYYADVRRRPTRLVFTTGIAAPIRIRHTVGFAVPEEIPVDLLHAVLMITADFAMHRGDEREATKTHPQAYALMQRHILSDVG
jgi:uncharacterized phiE125 gp8 family phage protein